MFVMPFAIKRSNAMCIFGEEYSKKPYSTSSWGNLARNPVANRLNSSSAILARLPWPQIMIPEFSGKEFNSDM